MSQPPNHNQVTKYAQIVRNCTVRMVREILEEAAKNGVPAPHHFYLTFQTNADGVVIPDWLAARYPETITIVLQHAYWDLEVSNDAVSVTLSFQGKPARLIIPFDAILNLTDPAVPNAGMSISVVPKSVAEPLLKKAEAEGEAAAQPAPAAAEKPQAEPRPDLGDNVIAVPFGKKR